MKIEVWSDFVCPFCYIGKRRLELALERFPHKGKVTVEFKSFELDPHAEKDIPMTTHELLSKKYNMPMEKVKEMTEGITQQAKEIGLKYNFDTMIQTNTFDAHRLVKYAEVKGKGTELIEQLLVAHFTNAKHIGNHDTLTQIAKEVGLDEEEVSSILKLNNYGKAVREDQREAQELGVQGVPFFVFNEKYGLSGAQPLEAFTQVLEKVWEEEKDRPNLKTLNFESKTSYCTGDGCE